MTTNAIRKTFQIAAVTVFYALLSACATPINSGLQQVEADLSAIKSDPNVGAKAPVAVYDAQKAVNKAKTTWDQTEDADETDHLVYLAKRKIEIAKYAAQRNLSDEQLKALDQQRQQLMLQSQKKATQQAEAKVRSLEDELMKMKELQPEKTDRGIVLTLGDVLFETAKANLNASAQNSLTKLAMYLADNPDRNILIEGHTDSRGSDEYNMGLSLRRADSVATFLERNGVDRLRIVTKGYGEMYPVASNGTDEGRQLNRRVELVVLDPGKTARDVERR